MFDHLRLYTKHMEKHPAIDLVSDSDGEDEMSIDQQSNDCAIGENVIATPSSSSSDHSSDTKMPDLLDERPFKCNFCARGFMLKGELKTHIGRHAAKKKANLNCLKCGLVFLTKPHLLGHKCLSRRKTFNL